MIYKTDGHGFFTEVCGIKVINADVRDMPDGKGGKLGSHTTTYNRGFPEGGLWHFTAGCQPNLAPGMVSRGYPTSPASVDRDGNIRQYLPVFTAGWHAVDASHVYFGVEHTCLPGTCDITDAQLHASAAIMAGVVALVKDHKGFVIPLHHVPGCPLTPGFKEHRDGAIPIHCSWDPKTHVDGLQGWGWPKYLDTIATLLKTGGQDDMALLDDIVKGEALAHQDKPLPPDAEPGVKWGYAKAKEMANVKEMANPRNHNHPGPGRHLLQ